MDAYLTIFMIIHMNMHVKHEIVLFMLIIQLNTVCVIYSKIMDMSDTVCLWVIYQRMRRRRQK